MGRGSAASCSSARPRSRAKQGCVRMEWEAEPNALGFYERLGAVHVRDSEPSEWGRVLAVMGVSLVGDRFASVYPLVTARSVARAFTYEVPDDVERGAIVDVRFGNARRRGIVTEVGVAAPDGVVAAPVERVADTLPPALVDLALWLADYYGSTPARALQLVAPYNAKRRGERRAPSAARWRRGPAGALSAPQEPRSRASPAARRRRGNLLLRRDRQRQDRGLHPRLRGCARARARRDRARAGDRADAADARPLPRALRRPRRRPALAR